MIHLSFLLWAAILMSTLILAHEFAHLLAAIAVGVKVGVFSLGFGRRLCGFSAYGIDFRLSAIPLGGYVRMHGENTTANETSAASGSFSSKPRAARALILLAGPLVNCLLAPILFSLLYWHGFIPLIATNQPTPIRLRTVLPNSAAADAGLLTGDVLQAASGQSLRNPERCRSADPKFSRPHPVFPDLQRRSDPTRNRNSAKDSKRHNHRWTARSKL